MRADLLMDAQIEVADSLNKMSAHGSIHDEDKETVLAGLAKALDSIKVILEGGICPIGCWVEPLMDQSLRAEIEGVRTDLGKIKTEAEKIIKKGGLAGIDPGTYSQVFELYADFMKNAKEIEHRVEYQVFQSDNFSEKIFYSIMIIWIAIATIAVVGLYAFERRRDHAEEKLKTSIVEKELLLREIHHRVKNNIQIMSSLLSIQSKYIDDHRVLELFKDYQNRIRSLALVHEKLYMSGNLANIDFRNYVISLTDNMVRTLGISRNITINIDIENILLNTDTAIPCGLIINELVSNSFKYAFPDGREGRITIALKKMDDEFILTVGDNGIGIDDGADISKLNTLGLGLVFNLVEKQLNGSVELDTAEGTAFTMRFKDLRYEKRF
jgi:two-component sensor histidine kinase